MDNIQFNIPVFVSKWHVEYKPIPLMSTKKVAHSIAYDFISNQTSFIDGDYSEYQNPKFDNTIQQTIDNSNIEYETHDFLRKHYIYKKKSWSNPKISLIHQYLIYLPYEYNPENKRLYELISKKSKTLKANDRLYQLIKGMK